MSGARIRPRATACTTVVPTGYARLFETFVAAFEQAARGKGLVRHGAGRPFEAQAMFTIPTLLGDTAGGFRLGQAVKKIQESTRLRDDPTRAVAELRGAMVYLAAEIMALEATR
jgi:hypothetical protein